MYTSKTQSKGFQPSPFQLIAAIMLIFIVAAIMPGASASQKKSPEEILAAAAENGKRMLAALKSYSYHSELTIHTYVFDVTPAIKLPDPEKSRDRYLKGRVWIDDLDLQVVKVAGEAVPSLKASRTARFESYFQNYGAYWFPAFTSAQDLLRAERDTTQVTVTLRMTSYKMTTR